MPDHGHALLELVGALDEAVVLLNAPRELVDLKLYHRAASRVRRDHPDQRHDADERHRNRLHKDLPPGHGPTSMAPSSAAVTNQLVAELLL